MGIALIWVEGLALALFALALATAWATRGHGVRGLWVALVYLIILGPAAFLTYATFNGYSNHGPVFGTRWVFYTLTWLVAFFFASLFLLWSGVRRPGAGLSRPGASWSRRTMWLGFAGAALALAFTIWNIDLAARADLAIARQEAGDLLLSMTPPTVPDAENAARVYAEAAKLYGEPIRGPLSESVNRGLDAKEETNWKDPQLAELVKKHEDVLALLRKAAAMPQCDFAHQRSVLDVVAPSRYETHKIGRGVTLLAIDARVKASEGNLKRAFEDIAAILGIFRHLSGYPELAWGREVIAWRALEDALRLAPAKEALPSLDIPELFPLVRKVCEEHALLGMVLPAAASQPSLVLDEVRRKDGSMAALAFEAAVVPTRVFLIPDELAAMHKLFENYRHSPRSSADESPKHWADLRQSVETDPTSVFSIVYIKPKHKKLLSDGSALAALRQTSRTGYAVAAYQRKHGKYPERLEQLVPEFLPAMPVDPRDGQPLRLKRVADTTVVYTVHDSETVAKGKLRDPDNYYTPAPIFRLSR